MLDFCKIKFFINISVSSECFHFNFWCVYNVGKSVIIADYHSGNVLFEKGIVFYGFEELFSVMRLFLILKVFVRD